MRGAREKCGRGGAGEGGGGGGGEGLGEETSEWEERGIGEDGGV